MANDLDRIASACERIRAALEGIEAEAGDAAAGHRWFSHRELRVLRGELRVIVSAVGDACLALGDDVTPFEFRATMNGGPIKAAHAD